MSNNQKFVNIKNVTLEELRWPAPKLSVDTSKLTQEEQADLIIKRLTYGISECLYEEDISYIMSKLIADEIDKEVLNRLKGL